MLLGQLQRVASLTVLPSTSGFAPDSGRLNAPAPQNAAGRPLGTRTCSSPVPALPLRRWAALTAFFRIRPPAPGFSAATPPASSLTRCSSRSSSFSRRASLISMCPNCFFHRWKVTSDTFSCRQISWMPFSPRSASLKMRIFRSSVVYRFPPFHSSGPFLRPRLTHQVARKNEVTSPCQNL